MKTVTIGIFSLLLAGAAHAGPRGPQSDRADGPVIDNPAPNVPLKQPKLSVHGFAHAPAPAKAGSNLQMGFTIRNTGDKVNAQGAYELRLNCENLQADGPACPFGQTSKPLQPVPVGQTRSVDLLTQPWPAGKFRITARIRKTGDSGAARGRPWSTTIQVQGGTIPVPEGSRLPAGGGFQPPSPMPQTGGSQAALTPQALRAHLAIQGVLAPDAPEPLEDDVLLACSVVGPSEFPHARITNDTDIAIPAGTEVRYAVGSLDNVFPMQLAQTLAPGQHVDSASFEAGLAHNPYSDDSICAAIAWAAG